MLIYRNKYFDDLERLEKILSNRYDAIVALKRSGFIMGVYLSNRLKTPMFTTSEISSIPDKFKNILLVDDKIYTGRSLRHWTYKLPNKSVTSATLYVEADVRPDIYIEDLGEVSKMFYEIID